MSAARRSLWESSCVFGSSRWGGYRKKRPPSRRCVRFPRTAPSLPPRHRMKADAHSAFSTVTGSNVGYHRRAGFVCASHQSVNKQDARHLHRGRPGRTVLRHPHQAAISRRGRSAFCERNRPLDTFGWGVVFSDADAGESARRGRADARANHRARSRTGTTSRSTSQGHAIRVRRPRFLPASRASGCCRSCRSAPRSSASNCGSSTRSTTSRPSAERAICGRRRRRQQPRARDLCGRVRTGPRPRGSAASSGSARRCRSTPSRSSSSRPSTAGSPSTPTASTKSSARSSSSAARRPGSLTGSTRPTPQQTIAFCERLFARYLTAIALHGKQRRTCAGAMAELHPRQQRALASRERRAPRRRRAHRALLGRLGHETGDGRRDRPRRLRSERRTATPTALATIREPSASIEVLKLQNAARNRMEWFENVARYATLPPEQFAYSLLTRSQRIGHENLRLRDATYVGRIEEWFAGAARRRCRRCSRRFGCASSSSRTASSSRRWTCTARSTACRTIFTSCISARARWAARAWCSRR